MYQTHKTVSKSHVIIRTWIEGRFAPSTMNRYKTEGPRTGTRKEKNQCKYEHVVNTSNIRTHIYKYSGFMKY